MTCFGPFEGCPDEDNPSQLVAEQLNNSKIIVNDNTSASIFSTVLNVTKESISEFEAHKDSAVIIHMGQAGGETAMRIDVTAGNEYRNEEIIKGGPKILPTTVDLSRCFQGRPSSQILPEPKRDNNGTTRPHGATRYHDQILEYHEEFSTKWYFNYMQGGIECNGIYYNSLYKIRMGTMHDRMDEHKDLASKKALKPVIFIHLPCAKDISIEEQKSFIRHAVVEILGTLD